MQRHYELDTRAFMTCSPNTSDRSAYEQAIAPFLKQDEKVLMNYGIAQGPDSPLPSLAERIEELKRSGDFLSVRTSTEACLDETGGWFSGSVAIIVVRKPQETHR